ncbi:hypothetical protein [Paenibacillus glucanolyticus]|uniref:hypothetical protein n=1 Tax=Paenibacillus glucanolyticus TaxID=59843 RepID=UPI00096EA93C|nr:hypothetical protein [Paenibacillus glucanolyticus]OMF76676.1 hypothetical protein BK142_14225 [Paenibacillus glucanolyticus]
MSTDNKLQSFSMYAVLEKPLVDFLEQGDGIKVLPVYEEKHFPDAEVVDTSLINLIKLLSTAFGRNRLAQAYKIIDRIQDTNAKKKTLRFRSRHPLFTDGSPKHQNLCLVSGMVYLGIPILPYFDGFDILTAEEYPSLDVYDNSGEHPALILRKNADLIY